MLQTPAAPVTTRRPSIQCSVSVRAARVARLSLSDCWACPGPAPARRCTAVAAHSPARGTRSCWSRGHGPRPGSGPRPRCSRSGCEAASCWSQRRYCWWRRAAQSATRSTGGPGLGLQSRSLLLHMERCLEKEIWQIFLCRMITFYFITIHAYIST